MAQITDMAPTNQPLGQIAMHHAFSVQVNDSGVQADSTGHKIIPAGTPIGGSADYLADETAVLSVSNDSNAKGILEYPIDVTSGQANGAMIDSGYINENAVKDVNISSAAKQAVAPKVVFFKRKV